MLCEVSVSRFIRRMTNGRTGPVLLEAERGDGSLVEVIAKFSGSGNIGAPGLVREALCAMLAADLGLPVPEPVLVRLEPDFMEALAETEPKVNQTLATSLPLGFGSTKLPPGFSAWMRDRLVPEVMRPAAAEIFAFDLLVQNPDRKPDNPNLQARGDQFAIFDHELALITEGVLFWQPPWVPGSLVQAGSVERHVLKAGLKGYTGGLERLASAWKCLPNERFDQYRAALPIEWDEAAGVADKGLTFLREVRDNAELAFEEVLRVLS